MKKWDEFEAKQTAFVTQHFQDLALFESNSEILFSMIDFFNNQDTSKIKYPPGYDKLISRKAKLKKENDELFGKIVQDMKTIFKIIHERSKD